MNYKKTFGWYYNSANDRTPSWSGVEYLYNFLTSNKGVGPTGRVIPMEQLEIADLVQLSFYPNMFSHSLLVVQHGEVPDMDNILIATHSEDSDYRPLSTYMAVLDYRFLKIDVK